MNSNRRVLWTLAFVVVVVLAVRGLLSIGHDGLSPEWLWP